MKIHGTVVVGRLCAGSKSEREGATLVARGERYALRRLGANPFRDEVLEALEGKRSASRSREDKREMSEQVERVLMELKKCKLEDLEQLSKKKDGTAC
jgi:hypothetical protein